MTETREQLAKRLIDEVKMEFMNRNLPAVIYEVIFDFERPARIFEVIERTTFRNPKLANGGHSIVAGFIIEPWGKK